MLDIIQIPDLGYNRDIFFEKVNKTVGKDNWFWAFSVEKKLYSWDFGFNLYEDAFWEFFRKDFSFLKTLIDSYFDVCVINKSDVDSGLNYKKQLQKKDHYNDIAIRRCLVRFGLSFKGKNLLELNESVYSQRKIPFHLPHLIKEPDSIASVASWLNSNRLIVVAPEIEDKAKFSSMLVR